MNDSYNREVAVEAIRTLCDLIRAIDDGLLASEGVGVDYVLKYADVDDDTRNWYQSLLNSILGDSSEDSRVPA
jgi:hypothetical protein